MSVYSKIVTGSIVHITRSCRKYIFVHVLFNGRKLFEFRLRLPSPFRHLLAFRSTPHHRLYLNRSNVVSTHSERIWPANSRSLTDAKRWVVSVRARACVCVLWCAAIFTPLTVISWQVGSCAYTYPAHSVSAPEACREARFPLAPIAAHYVRSKTIRGRENRSPQQHEICSHGARKESHRVVSLPELRLFNGTPVTVAGYSPIKVWGLCKPCRDVS